MKTLATIDFFLCTVFAVRNLVSVCAGGDFNTGEVKKGLRETTS
jgi:hypothetical protein